MSEPGELTRLLAAWRGGDSKAFDELLPMVYQELHKIARHHWSQQPPGHTLQPTALINEAFLKLAAAQPGVPFQNRTHFFALASTAMRQILVNHARATLTEKRAGGWERVPLEVAAQKEAKEVCALHDALTALDKIDPRKTRVVELRYFGGLTIDETAEALSVSPKTIVRDWEIARAWLLRELGTVNAL